MDRMIEEPTKIYIVSVDDDDDINKTTLMLLQAIGYHLNVVQFSNGVEFMESLELIEAPHPILKGETILIEKQEMDILIIDINMPHFNVVEAVEKVCKNFPMAYIIVASGDDDPELITFLQNTYHTWGYVIKSSGFGDKLVRLVKEAAPKVLYRKKWLEIAKETERAKYVE